MRILFVCGGTAGHINPALVVAEKFKDKSTTAKILFVGAPDSMEEKLVGAAGFDFVPIVVEGLSRKLSIKGVIRNINSLKVLARASGRAKEIIRNFQPNLIFGTGGYITYPILKHGMKMGVKTAIHEQNAFPGITNKALAKKADRVFVANTQAANLLKTRNPPIVTGNPIRESLIYTSGQKARIRLGLDEKPLIYSAGGSLGAHTVNKIVADIIAWHAGKNLVNHIHGYGRNGVNSFHKMLKERGVSLQNDKRIRISEYINHSDICLAAADLVISRCGAITISELQVAGKPSILIPSPNVTENHQYYNGKVLSDAGAAILLEEKNYNKAELIAKLSNLLDTPDMLKRMGKAASKMAVTNTADVIVDELLTLMDF